MFKKITSKVQSVVDGYKMASHQLKHQYPYEIINAAPCPKTGQHRLEIKLTGKSQSVPYFAEEIVVDNNFLLSFSPVDISTITYLATCDRYEKILQEERIKKCYEVIRGHSRQGKKTVQIRNKLTNEIKVISLNDFANDEIIDNLSSRDAYHLGYLAGQEQMLKDYLRLKMISGC